MHFYFKLVQFLACLVIFLFSITPNKLQGRLFYNGAEQIICLMESAGGPCEKYTFYRPSLPMKNGFSALFSADEDVDGGGGNDEDSSRRILAILDASKLSKDTNTTDEMKLRALLLFEWKSAQHHSDTLFNGNQTAVDEAAAAADPSTAPILEVVTALNASSSANETAIVVAAAESASRIQSNNGTAGGGDGGGISTMDTVVYIPVGVATYRISIWNTKASKSMYDQFGFFADSLWNVFINSACAMTFMELSLLVLAFQYKANQAESMHDATILLMSAIGSFIFCVFLCSFHIDWEALWQCTNFRPELPAIISVTSFFSTFNAVLLTAEILYCTCELWIFYADEQQNATAAAKQHKRNGAGTTKTTTEKRNNASSQLGPSAAPSSAGLPTTNESNNNNNRPQQQQQQQRVSRTETFYITVHTPSQL